MKLVGISGALRKASTNTGTLRALRDLLPAHATMEIVTLHGIPLFDEDLIAAHGKPEIVLALAERIRAADGLIIATPEYQFSVPGVLKNATDWLSTCNKPFRWKRAGIVGSSEGAMAGTARAQYHLRQNLQALEAITMPRPEVLIVHNEVKFDKTTGDLTDGETRQRLAKWLTAFLEWVEKKP
ncbi:MAG: NAD(P)H-dependent oxidoreductase [Rhizobiales bacterium]|nr:NAD(P)H-dependent oxidoreductase [Hyphomicrobiales bacterium]